MPLVLAAFGLLLMTAVLWDAFETIILPRRVTRLFRLARLVTVIEGGMGFGFLAIVISYLPVLYGAFSQREVNISLLDARAGSPPSAVELLRRHLEDHRMDALSDYLRDWETWSAQLME